MKKENNDIKMVGVNDVRDINQTIFLHLIRERQPISRAEIAKHTGLRAGTVSSIVNRLIKNKLVYEGTQGPSSGGRPPRHLFINAESLYVLAVDIGVSDTVIAVSDFNGRVVKQSSILTENSAEKFLEKLGEKIEDILKNQYPRANFGAIGISVPGLINRETGSIVTSPNLEWSDVPLREFLIKRFDLPVFIENDANAAAFSELWFGPLSEANVRTLLFVLVVEGLGTGLIINGELHVGSRLGLGGFGHMSIDPNGELCSCGRRGCWETFASERATVERYHRVTKKQGSPVIGINDLIALANNGDEIALESLKITASHLGDGISNLVHGIYPETVVVGGAITAAWHIIEPIIKEKLRSRYVVSPEQVNIRPASLPRPSLYGAIPIALQNCLRESNGLNKNSIQSLKRK